MTFQNQPTITTSKRNRFQFKFWLDCAKNDELLLAEEADHLKRQRLWQPTIRDALRLILDLRKRKVDVLLALFPWIEEYFRVKFAPQESPANIEFARLIERQTAILERLAMQPVQASGAEPRLLTMPKFEHTVLAGSAFVEAVAEDPREARANFAAGMGNLFGDDDDDF